MTPLLQATHITTGYAPRKAARHIVSEDISLELYPGELVCLVGPNGSGKSTLLRTLTGLQVTLDGNVLLKGKDIRSFSPMEKAKFLSIVLTTPVQAGRLTVYDLTALGRYPYTDWAGSLSQKDHLLIRNALATIGIEEFAPRMLHELSDGERQKVMVARALAQNPNLVVLDEPTAFLDIPFRIEIMSILKKIISEGDRGILLSTHDLDLAMRTADRLWVLSRDGTFHSGAPEDLVLKGVITDVFTAGGISFDSNSGHFTIPTSFRGNIHLTGENSRARLWTGHTLHRLGYSTESKGDTSISLEIRNIGDTFFWDLKSGTEQITFTDLSELSRWLGGQKAHAA